MTQAVSSITNRTLSGLFWMSLASGANVIALLLVLVVLARMLTPADFGLAAVALMVTGFSAIFSEFGIGPAVVQRPDLRPAHLRSGFTLSFFLGVLLGVITWLAAPLVAEFFQLAELTPILRTLSWIFPVQSLAVVSESLLQRELRFRCLAILDVVAAVLGYGVLGICLAMLGCGAWALVGAQMAQATIKTVLLLCVRPHAAWPVFDRRACADLLYFGGGFTAGRFSNYAAGQGEHVVIGYCLGAVALGVYGRAYQLMAGPAVLFGNVLDRVLFPAMVQVQDQPSRLAHAYRRGTALIALVILPVSAVLVALAPEVIVVLLGPEWHSVTLPLQILGIGMLFRTGCKISDSLVRATGAVYRRTWRQTAYAVLVVAGAWLGQRWGIEGVALAILVTLAINFLLMAQLGLGLAKMSWRTFAAAHVSGLAFAALVGVPVATVAELLRAADQEPVVVLVFSTCACIPAVLLAAYFPRIFLGEDGTWMVCHLKAFLVQARHTANPAATSAAVGSSRQPAAAAGSLLGSLVRSLGVHGIRYCRWKRPLNLERVLNGDGDLDLLVDANHADDFLRLAEGLGFKRLVSCFEPLVRREMHLYGLDHDTGVLLHLHVHSSLFGNFWGDGAPALDAFVLRHASPDVDGGLLAGMPVVHSAAEQIVVVLRAMEQYARLSNLPTLVAHKRCLQAKLHAGLKTSEMIQDCTTLLERWLPAVPPALFAECRAALAEPTSWLCRHRLGRRLQRRITGASADFGPIGSRVANKLKALWWRLRHGSGSPKKLPLGGSVIAFIGPDASGKSTMVAETTQLLGRVFRVEAAHLGKPPSTWLTLPPNLLLRLMRVLTPQLRISRQEAAAEVAGRPVRHGLLYRLRAVLLAWDRRALALRLAAKATRGWVVVCDRYPTAVVGAPDGARLATAGEGSSGLRSWLARLENRLYRQVPPPSVVVRLTSPLAVAIERNQERIKPGKESDDFVTRRHKQFFLPHFPDSLTVELDTNQTKAATIGALRQLVWQALRASPVRHALNGTRPGQRSRVAKNVPVVEFIGVTGVGKSTLIAAAADLLARQGFRVRAAEDVMLARYGLSFPRQPKLRSALVHFLALPPFLGYLCTREGIRLSRLAVGSIVRSRGGLWTEIGLLRNFSKRVGCHLLLEKARRELHDSDVIFCDEGVVHAAHNLFVHTGSEPNREAIVLFGQLVPKPDLLIWVSAPTSQSAEVIVRRGHSRVRGTSAAALAFAEHAHATFELLASVAGLRERIHRLDNSADAAASCATAILSRASALCEFLKQHLGVCPGATVSAPVPKIGCNGLVLAGGVVPMSQPAPALACIEAPADRDDVGLLRFAMEGVHTS